MESSCIIYTPISFEINIDKLHFLLKKTHLCIYIYSGSILELVAQSLHIKLLGSIMVRSDVHVRGADTTWVWSASPIRWSTVVHWPCPTAPRLEGCASPWPQQRVTGFSSDVELEFFHLYVYMYDKYRCDIYIYVCMYDIKYYIYKILYIWNIKYIRHVILIILYLISMYIYIYDI